MTVRLQEVWERAWSALGAEPRPELLEQVLARYREPHRRYHTLEHLQECLAQLAAAPHKPEHPGEVALALWFHDAVYALDRHDNEDQSAQWLQREATQAGVSTAAAGRMHALVMCTRHSGPPDGADAGLIVDIDLSILGADPTRFAAYERQIRQEYQHVPEPVFRANRAALLEALLARESLYNTPYFRGQLESRARDNLGASLAALTGVSPTERSEPSAGQPHKAQ